jgi:hypothetical protein
MNLIETLLLVFFEWLSTLAGILSFRQVGRRWLAGCYTGWSLVVVEDLYNDNLFV